MIVEVLADATAVAAHAARHIAAAAREAVAARGCFTIALSGGATPWKMLRALAQEDVPWEALHLWQVDERIAPPGDDDRNLTHLTAALRDGTALEHTHLHPMPVEASDLDAAAAAYADELAAVAGTPPVLDLVHLGLGADGHTASLVPGDPVLQVTDRAVATTGTYQGRRRMTLTYPLVNRARQILWLVTGASKVTMLERLRAGDISIPGGRVSTRRALLIADRDAAPPAS